MTEKPFKIFSNNNPARVDVVLFTLKEDVLHVALFKRNKAPYKGSFALPGGFVHEEDDDTLLDAAFRVLKEKTGIQSPYLEELCTFSGKVRDPRGWSMTVAHYAVVHLSMLQAMQSDDFILVPVDQLGKLPFDHNDIVSKALERVRSKSGYSTLPVFFCEEHFTLSQLQRVYEIVTKTVNNPENFQRKLKELDAIEKVPQGKAESARGRRAQLYRLKSSNPSLLSRARGIIS